MLELGLVVLDKALFYTLKMDTRTRSLALEIVKAKVMGLAMGRVKRQDWTFARLTPLKCQVYSTKHRSDSLHCSRGRKSEFAIVRFPIVPNSMTSRVECRLRLRKHRNLPE